MVLEHTGQELVKQQEVDRNVGGEGDELVEEYDQGYDDIVFFLKPIADEVKGFDFKK